MPNREWIAQLEDRTKRFKIRMIFFCASLERAPGLRDTSWPLNKAAGSVAANHRAMRRARSDDEFAAKLQIVDEECDECVFWLEVIEETRPPAFAMETEALLNESRELRAIFGKAKGTFGRRLD